MLLDEGAPIGSAEPFIHSGHQVIYHSDVLSPGAKDDIVAATALNNNACLLAIDKDMKQLVKRFGNALEGGRYKRLNLIFISCSPVLAPKRIAHCLSFIEHEWAFCCEKKARALWLDISTHRISSYR